MKALRFHGRKDLRVDGVEGPKSCGPHQVLVKNAYCGICGTDLHEYLHGPIQIPQKPHPFSKAVLPLILGHEFSGVVLETGADVRNVRVGDRVSIQPNVIPGGDYYDRRGWSHLSDNLSVVGLSYPWGGMAERCLVYDYNVAALPPEVSDEQGAMIEPAAVAVNAIEHGDLRAGDTILVTGGGPIGALVAAHHCGTHGSRLFSSHFHGQIEVDMIIGQSLRYLRDNFSQLEVATESCPGLQCVRFDGEAGRVRSSRFGHKKPRCHGSNPCEAATLNSSEAA